MEPIKMNENIESTVDQSQSPEKIIKHLVIAGGGVSGLIAFGVLRRTHDQGIWNMENIESIYGTSIGALLAVTLALKYDWQVIEDYLIQRPWHHVFKYDIYSIFGAFEKCGIFTISTIEEMIRPLFNGLDISMNITMSEFYEMTHIDIHTYCTDINDFSLVDISYKTHPDWRVVDAMYASTCLPIFFTPFSKEGKFYVDGGVFLNYPLEPCIQNVSDPDEILGIRKKYIQTDSNNISQTSSLLDYILILLNKTLESITKDVSHQKIKNEYIVEAAVISAVDLFKMASSEEDRRRWIRGTNGSPLTPPL